MRAVWIESLMLLTYTQLYSQHFAVLKKRCYSLSCSSAAVFFSPYFTGAWANSLCRVHWPCVISTRHCNRHRPSAINISSILWRIGSASTASGNSEIWYSFRQNALRFRWKNCMKPARAVRHRGTGSITRNARLCKPLIKKGAQGAHLLTHMTLCLDWMHVFNRHSQYLSLIYVLILASWYLG